MAQALFQVQVTFKHIAGANNTLADALSRAHISPSHEKLANEIIQKYNIERCEPCLYVLDIVSPVFHDRSGAQHTGDQGRGQAAERQGTSNIEQQAIRGHQVPILLPGAQDTATAGQSFPCLYVHRGPGRPPDGATYRTQPYSTHKGPLHPCRPLVPKPGVTSQGAAGPSGDSASKGLHIKPIDPIAGLQDTGSHAALRPHYTVQHARGGGHHVLRRPTPGRATATVHKGFQPVGTPYPCRPEDSEGQHANKNKTCKEHAALQSNKNYHPPGSTVTRSLPGAGSQESDRSRPHSGPHSAIVCVPTLRETSASIICQKAMGLRTQETGHRPYQAYNALNQKVGRHGRVRRGLQGAPDTGLWRMGLSSL